MNTIRVLDNDDNNTIRVLDNNVVSNQYPYNIYNGYWLYQSEIYRNRNNHIDLKYKKAKDENVNKICTICTENIILDQKIYIPKKCCKSIFHYNCIKEWTKYKQTCPICRKILDEGQC